MRKVWVLLTMTMAATTTLKMTQMMGLMVNDKGDVMMMPPP